MSQFRVVLREGIPYYPESKTNKQFKYIEDIQIFGMNMPFISSSEAKNIYFMSGEATNEIYIFSLHEMK